jgi:hypothetical protein
MSKARLVITAVTVEKRPVSEVARSYGVADLRQRGEFEPDDLGHRVMAEHEPLTAAGRLEMMAAGEVLARYYRHPTEMDRAAKAGATWEQIGATRGTTADQARADYREWAIGQHALHEDMGRWGIGDDEYAAAMARAGGDRARCVVTFDLTDDRDTDFVLTEALREFAARQRADAEDEEPGSLSAAEALARVLLERSCADQSFRSDFSAWRSQRSIRAAERSLRDAA